MFSAHIILLCVCLPVRAPMLHFWQVLINVILLLLGAGSRWRYNVAFEEDGLLAGHSIRMVPFSGRSTGQLLNQDIRSGHYYHNNYRIFYNFTLSYFSLPQTMRCVSFRVPTPLFLSLSLSLYSSLFLSWLLWMGHFHWYGAFTCYKCQLEGLHNKREIHSHSVYARFHSKNSSNNWSYSGFLVIKMLKQICSSAFSTYAIFMEYKDPCFFFKYRIKYSILWGFVWYHNRPQRRSIFVFAIQTTFPHKKKLKNTPQILYIE